MIDARHYLGACIGASGIDALYGPPLAGLGIDTGSTATAVVLAATDERVHGGLVAAHLGGQVLQLGMGDVGFVGRATSYEDLAPAISAAAAERRADPTRCVRLRIDFDLEGRVPPVASIAATASNVWQEADGDICDRVAQAQRLVFLVGPEILRARAEAGLRALAAVTSAGVLNTWGAKGVFYWRSRHHLSTIGLQLDDYVAGGMAEADLVVVSGIDVRESPPHRWAHLAPSVEVAPQMLASMSEVLSRPRREIAFPVLRERLVAATNWGYESTRALAAPTALTRHYAAAVGPTGLVAADPGRAGFFVARTLPTEAPWSVHVPADRNVDGAAVAACVVAQLRTPNRRCVAVVDGMPTPLAEELLDLAARLGLAVAVESWGDEGTRGTAADQASDIARSVLSRDNVVRRVHVDWSQIDRFEDAAGPITAWTE